MTHSLFSNRAPMVAILALLGACGGTPAAIVDAGGADIGTSDAGATDASVAEDTGGAIDGGPQDAGSATESPMGTDCTDTCPSFEGRDYVCTFLPGFPTDIGYCSLACTTGDPSACVDTEPGEVYCNADVGRCVIGCPFSGCPNDMECTFHFADQPACEPVP